LGLFYTDNFNCIVYARVVIARADMGQTTGKETAKKMGKENV
jgi:hypothetical protein